MVSFDLGGEKLKLSRPYTGVFVIALFFVCAIPLSAQTAEPLPPNPPVDESTLILGESPATQAPNGGSSIFVVIRMVLVLALSALAIYGVFFFVRRLARPQENRDPHLKVLARVPLGNDSYAAVVSIGAKAWLVGGGSGGINLISDISDNESLEAMMIDDANRTAETGIKRYFDFSSMLRRFGSPQSRKGQSPDSNTGNLRKQRERLKML